MIDQYLVDLSDLKLIPLNQSIGFKFYVDEKN